MATNSNPNRDLWVAVSSSGFSKRIFEHSGTAEGVRQGALYDRPKALVVGDVEANSTQRCLPDLG
jgi:hypothetical protein